MTAGRAYHEPGSSAPSDMMMLIKREMALFGMVWLLRVRAEMRRCAKCHREAMAREREAREAAAQAQAVASTSASGVFYPRRRQRSVEQQTDWVGEFSSGGMVQSHSADDILSPATTTTSFYCPELGSGSGNTSFYSCDEPRPHTSASARHARTQCSSRDDASYNRDNPPHTPGRGGSYCQVHGYIPPKPGKLFLCLFNSHPD